MGILSTMKAVITTSFFLLLFLQSHAQLRFTYFNEQFETVKERKAFYFTNQFFQQRGEETVVLTPMAGGEKLLVSFLDGKMLRKSSINRKETLLL